eukprot:scaffold6036_cov371-Prasinococcus_capsulatus_cf.AAC.8
MCGGLGDRISGGSARCRRRRGRELLSAHRALGVVLVLASDSGDVVRQVFHGVLGRGQPSTRGARRGGCRRVRSQGIARDTLNDPSVRAGSPGLIVPEPEPVFTAIGYAVLRAFPRRAPEHSSQQRSPSHSTPHNPSAAPSWWAAERRYDADRSALSMVRKVMQYCVRASKVLATARMLESGAAEVRARPGQVASRRAESAGVRGRPRGQCCGRMPGERPGPDLAGIMSSCFHLAVTQSRGRGTLQRTYKQQHDTDKDLKYLHVFPAVSIGRAGAGGASSSDTGGQKGVNLLGTLSGACLSPPNKSASPGLAMLCTPRTSDAFLSAQALTKRCWRWRACRSRS